MKKLEYFTPDQVTTPRQNWNLVKLLHVGPNEGDGYSVAAGTWDGTRCIAMRWNPCDERPLGNPQSRGLPTWFIIPSELNQAVISTLPKESQDFALSYLK